VSRSLRVLIVEDEFLVASFVGDLLEEWGHEVVAMCVTGQAAIERLRQGGIELAILDIKLKDELTGVDVANVAREHAVAHVFLSGSGDPVTRAAAQATYPLAFLQKPLDQNKLRSLLATLLAETIEA
jgi:two-component system, response regulator PdtaR